VPKVCKGISQTRAVSALDVLNRQTRGDDGRLLLVVTLADEATQLVTSELCEPLFTKTVDDDDIKHTLDILDDMGAGVHLRKKTVVIKRVFDHLNVVIGLNPTTGALVL
jgi:hypothetical protein